MKNNRHSSFLRRWCTSLGRVCAYAKTRSFEFKPNDRVVVIGDALVERDIQYNYLETMFSPVRLHGKGVTFRNVGWSGDTVWGEARAVFGTQKDGYNALVRIINETRPTVAFVCYGMNESFAGPDGLAKFEAGYNTLLDNLTDPAKDKDYVAAPKAEEKDRKGKIPDGQKTVLPRAVPRVVLVSPIAFQIKEAPEPARNGKQNENLKLYADAVKKIAEKRGMRFVDLYEHFSNNPGEMPKIVHVGQPMPQTFKLTSDGMHLTPIGYMYLADGIQSGLGLPQTKWSFEPNDGIYDAISQAPKTNALEKLRSQIAAKNLQFFNKWRPQNETYLFLFRKGEQGKNAHEIPEFDPYIEAREAEIGKLADETAKALGL